MITFLRILVLLLQVNYCFAQFIEGSVIGVPARSPQRGDVIVNDYTLPGEWLTIDISHAVPNGTKAVELAGVLIITRGSAHSICGGTLAFRQPGERWEYGYVMQAGSPPLDGYGSTRSNATAWVPVVNGRFEMKWQRQTAAPWPDDCSYAANLSIQAYVR